jgi:putative phosphoesterase
MRLGLISDTHDNVPMIKQVIRHLNGLDVSLVLHAGDYISPFTAKPYSELKAEMIGVLGNNCAEREKLREVYAAVGKEIVGNFAEVEVGGRRIALLHGHDDALLRSLTAHGDYDVVVHGHDHKVKVEKRRSMLVINPGEVCGYVSGRSSFGILDTDRLEVDIHDLSE